MRYSKQAPFKIMTAPLTLLGGLSTAEFLAQYWQQQPLLVRQAVPDFSAPLSADELAGLACELAVESRIIEGSATRQDWRLRHGPFDDTDFAALGERDWTLLVQAVDHYVPQVADIRSLFRFLPDWRLDDIMVSFAAPGGSVGPHFDQYDVFLLQGQGRREWQVGKHCPHDATLQHHDDLQLLASFEAKQRWTLEPGDIISTGTPSGVGSSTGTFLKPGDVVETEIEGLGVLRNPVEAEA